VVQNHEAIDAQRLIDHRPEPSRDGQTPIIRSPLERIGRIAALVPPRQQHRHRDDGVLAPNAPLRPAVTALAPTLLGDAFRNRIRDNTTGGGG